MRFAGSVLGDFRHVCAFFSSNEDEYKTLLPFMREGFEAGERVVNFMPGERTDHEDRLRAGGIDVDEGRRTHQLEVLKSEDAYIQQDGHFDGDAMLALVPQVLMSGRDFGFRITRLVAHAEHIMKDSDNTDAFIEYESRLNYILPKHADPVVCTYDLNKVDAGVVMDALRTHPMVIIGGLLQENPFFVSPDVFLQELNDRRSRRRKGGTQKPSSRQSGNGRES
jgi:hypothetical protein